MYVHSTRTIGRVADLLLDQVTVGVVDPRTINIGKALAAVNRDIPTWPTLTLTHPDVVKAGYLSGIGQTELAKKSE